MNPYNIRISNVYGVLQAKVLEESLIEMLQVFLFVASYQSSCWTRWAERRCSKYGGRESTEAAMGSVPGLRCPNIHSPHTLSTKTQKSAPAQKDDPKKHSIWAIF